MEEIHKEHQHKCIQQSNLAKQFESNESISIPKKYILTEIKIQTDEELMRILEVFRYWMVDDMPKEVYDYVMSITHKNVSFIGLADYQPIKELMFILEYVEKSNFEHRGMLKCRKLFLKYLFD